MLDDAIDSVPNSAPPSRSQKSISSESTALLYKYGQEVGPSSLRSSGSFGGKLGISQSYDQFLQSQSQSQHSFGNDDETMISQVTSSNLRIPSKPLKMVSGSQFRLTTKGTGPCPSCEALERTNKKSKETIRALKLQILRMEENFKDLKYAKNRDSFSSTESLKISADSSFVPSEDKELAQRYNALEEELAKLKKVLAYERNINDGMRHSLEEAKTTHQTEMKKMNDELLLTSNKNRNMEETISSLQRTKADFELKILMYKQQLEKAQQELEEALL